MIGGFAIIAQAATYDEGAMMLSKRPQTGNDVPVPVLSGEPYQRAIRRIFMIPLE